MAFPEFGMDKYDRNARLKPALLLFLPATLTVIALAPDAVLGWSGGIAAIIQAGGSFLLAQIVGDIGKRKEPELFKSFGGRPTERLLSHEHSPNKVILADRHRKLAKLVPKRRMPTAETEKKDPAAALEIYSACVEKLRAFARGDKAKFGDVHRENIHYGFRRNLWALKAPGIAVCTVALCIVVAEIYGHIAAREQIKLMLPIIAGIETVLLVSWIFVITRNWVKRAAVLYADRLIEVLDTLVLP